MKTNAVLIGLLAIALASLAQAAIPGRILDQQIVDYDNDLFGLNGTRIMISPTSASDYLSVIVQCGPSPCSPIEIKLADWRLSTKDEAKQIADAFISNSEGKLGFALSDLKLREAVLTTQTQFDYHNPSATVSYDQQYHGIPVYDGRVGVNINAYGTIYAADPGVGNITAPTQAVLTSDEAVQKAKDKYGVSELNLAKGPELIIYGNKLAWFLSMGMPIGKDLYIDSQDGSVVSERQNWVEQGGGSPNDDEGEDGNRLGSGTGDMGTGGGDVTPQLTKQDSVPNYTLYVLIVIVALAAVFVFVKMGWHS